MKYILTFPFVCLFLNFGFNQNCFNDFYENGKIAYESLKFETAIKQFRAAKVCDDLPVNNDVDEWIEKTQSGYIEVIKIARDSALLLKAEADRLRKEAEQAREEADALRFFVTGQERELRGFLQEAVENYSEAIRIRPKDMTFRERRVLLTLSDSIAMYELAIEDLKLLVEFGEPSKKTHYLDDLAYAYAKLNDFSQARIIQTTALEIARPEEKHIFENKIEAYDKNKVFDEGAFARSARDVTITVRAPSGYAACKTRLTLEIDGKLYYPNEITNQLKGIKPGIYQWEVKGVIGCNTGGITDRAKKWAALGKGTIDVRSGVDYSLTWQLTKGKKCEVKIDRY